MDQAKSDIDKAFTLAPQNGLALALQSIIAVVQNEKDKALTLALEATKAEPESVSVKMALSYADQANFDLSKALVAVQEATKIDLQDALARARLAELWLAHGELDQALESAKQAVALNPREARAQTVLGFAYLTEIKTSEAKDAFEKAITLGQADPMPRLGLGLAKIREGDLEQGRKQIEIAATLDPNNPLIRSYLGKAYYEEKRDPQAEVQFQQAKELDPNDPTPYLYDAIRRQTINRPVEALHDLQKSIELNDNRAVYRSRLLLDSDLAARNVSLARIYEDLGFQQLALVEGWKSVNQDPANYSAHRLLADSYGALQRSEIAQVSELLQAQLLQPLNSNPVQPRLGEAAPAILAGAGPVAPSFNEFNQLFIRDRHQLLVSGIVGGQSTLGEEVILTGLEGRYSYSIGQFHYETNGFRTNDYLNQNIYDVFAQTSLTPKASIQGEVLFNGTRNGDIDLRFDPTISPTLSDQKKDITYRLGLHYSVTPGSDILASFFYAHTNDNFIDLTPVGAPPGSSEIGNDGTRGYNGEAQYLLTTNRLDLIAGAGYFDGKDTSDITVVLAGFPLPPIMEHPREYHTNFYVYSHIKLPINTTLTLGGSVDLFKGPPIDRDQLNPKLGLISNLTPSTTLRIAVIRVLKRPLIENQTLEPTQVAGFQQYFDDLDATESWREGIGIDQKFSLDVFGGLEFSKRQVAEPVNFLSTGVTIVKMHEQLGRAYLYWTPFTWMAANAEYQFEGFDSPMSVPLGITNTPPKITTHRVPFGLDFFHPSGFFAKLKATYVDQEVNYFNVSSVSFEPGEDHFWLLDASIGYRLPNRLGIFTIEAKNIFNQGFQYQETEFANPLFQPKRLIFTKLTLAF